MLRSLTNRVLRVFRSRQPSVLKAEPLHGATDVDIPVTGVGLSDPRSFPTQYEHAAGIERVEYLADLSGKNIFLNEPLKINHYGTLANPIIVDSLYEERIVGCSGFPKESHEILWMTVKGTERCQECGQAFKINQIGH